MGSTRVLPGWPLNVGAGTVLPGPGGGVVVVSTGYVTTEDESLFVTTALRRDGRRLWVHRRDPWCGNCDSGAQRTSGVTALVASTGVQVWRTRPSDRAELLSVGRSGRVYVSIGATARRGVRALRLGDGSSAWERRTRLPVRDALELSDGSVVVSAGTSYPTTKADRLTRLRPR